MGDRHRGWHMIEREITEPIDLCRPDGTLNHDAVGWSRRPLQRCNLSGHAGRKKRWDFWAVTTDQVMLSLTYADLDYLGLITVLVTELESGREFEKGMVVPGALGMSQPDTVGGADIRFGMPGLRIAFLEEEGGTRLVARCNTITGRWLDVDVLVTMPPNHETLTVVVPWSDHRFQLTSKHNTRPAVGQITVSNRVYSVGPDTSGFGTLDYGRGMWPRKTRWNWASASGVEDGRTIGLQLGAQWTDHTGSTENAVCLDGRLHKISDELVFEHNSSDLMQPWRIRCKEGDAVDLTFTPIHQKRVKIELLLAGSALRHCIGHFSGRVTCNDGTSIEVCRVLGWAEEMHARW